MEYKKSEIKKGINLHTIKTDKFKTNLIAIFLTTKLERETVTKNAVISALLRRGSKNTPTQEQISTELEEMYGASFDCGLDKTGDNQVLKFYIETINDKFLPRTDESMLKTAIEKIIEIVFNPLTENEGFKKEYVEQEKNNIRQIIEGKIDNKASYSLDRCIEEMYKNEPFGLYKFGYIEDLNNINENNLYDQYKKLKEECKIDIFVSGDIAENVEEILKSNTDIKELKEREAKFVANNANLNKKDIEEKTIIENMDVTQGKLILGLDVNLDNEELKYDTMVYNSLLGGSANSKMFQNVREKAHLAYVASSSYHRIKNNIFVRCGIEISNYGKALELIRKQIEDMKSGDFTEEEVENAKKGILAAIKLIDDEQDTQITYCFGQELSKNKVDVESYMKKIQKVNKQDVINIANKVKINTIYFLRN